MSRPSEPVDTTAISSTTAPSSMRITEPLPNCFSICAKAAASALLFSDVSTGFLSFIQFFQQRGNEEFHQQTALYKKTVLCASLNLRRSKRTTGVTGKTRHQAGTARDVTALLRY